MCEVRRRRAISVLHSKHPADDDDVETEEFFFFKVALADVTGPLCDIRKG